MTSDFNKGIPLGKVTVLAGESGAGKSMTGSAIIGLIEPPGYIDKGEIWLENDRIDQLPIGKANRIRGRRISMVFQDPLTSLNPLKKIGDQLIEINRLTIAKIFKSNGYSTAVVGKWHLGLGFNKIDYNAEISPGPNQLGFDYSYIMPDTQDRVPTVYIENGRVVNLDANDPIEVDFKTNFQGQPTGKTNPELLKMKWHHGHNGSIVNGVP